jgi:hypothetical protein
MAHLFSLSLSSLIWGEKQEPALIGFMQAMLCRLNTEV